MNILVLSDGYPTESHRMSGLFAFDQAKALQSIGHNVVFGCVNFRSIKHRNKPGIYKCEKDGITIYTINCPLGRIPSIFLKEFQSVAFQMLYRRIRSDGVEVDIVHAHFYDMGYCAAKNKKIFGYKVVLTEHYSGYVKNEKKTVEHLKKHYHLAYEQADIVLAVGNQLAQQLKHLYRVNVEVVPNVVDTTVFNEALEKRCSRTDEIVRFVAVGRLTEQKNLELLIKAFSRALITNKNMTLSIIGNGVLYQKLSDLIREETAENEIYLLGGMSREEIAMEFSKADCFVLLSSYETFGVVYIEALAAGLPVIATSCGGPEDFIKKEYGILLDNPNEEIASKAIIQMSNTYLSYNAKFLSKDINSRFSPKVIANKLNAEYTKCFVK